jgi:hypothetical protein
LTARYCTNAVSMISSRARRNRVEDSPRASFASQRSTHSNDTLDASRAVLAASLPGIADEDRLASSTHRRRDTARVAARRPNCATRAPTLRAKTNAWAPRGRGDVKRRNEIATDSDFSPRTARLTSVTRVVERTHGNNRTNQSTNQPARSVNKDNDVATTTTRPTLDHARHATPTPATPTPRASRRSRSAENASCVCSENAFSFTFSFSFSSLHFGASSGYFTSLHFTSGYFCEGLGRHVSGDTNRFLCNKTEGGEERE